MRLACALVLHAAAAFVAPKPPRPAVLRAGGDFENPNPFMKDVIDAVPTLQEGKTMQLVLGSEEPTPPSDAEQQKLRAAAADELRNIDGAERSRRLAAGRVLINGRSGSLQFSGDRLGAAGQQVLYGWSPLALLGAVTEERAAASASLILGAEVRLAGAAALPHFERAPTP